MSVLFSLLAILCGCTVVLMDRRMSEAFQDHPVATLTLEAVGFLLIIVGFWQIATTR